MIRSRITSHESALHRRGPLPIFHYLDSMATRPNWSQRAIVRTKRMMKGAKR